MTETRKVTLTFDVERLTSTRQPTDEELMKALGSMVVGRRFTVFHDLPDKAFVGVGYRVKAVTT